MLAAVEVFGGEEEQGEEARRPRQRAVPAAGHGHRSDRHGRRRRRTGQGDPAAGQEVFASAGCGTCHTLEEAGTAGTVGPDLDDSQVDLEQATAQITDGGGGMPAFSGQLSEEEIQNVAAFVVESQG